MIDAQPLARRSFEILNQNARALDGLLDIGHYGATLKEGAADVYVSRELAGVGLLTLIDNDDPEATHWLSHQCLPAYMIARMASRQGEGHVPPHECELGQHDRDFDLAAIGRNNWLVLSVVLWPTLVEAAARDNILLEVIERQADKPERHDPIAESVVDAIREAVGAATEMIVTTDGVRIGMVGGSLLSEEEMARVRAPQTFEQIQALMAEIAREHHEGHEADEALTLSDQAYARASEAAQSVIHAVGPHIAPFVGDGYFGAPAAADQTPEAAHLHALVNPATGLVEVHAHQELGARFIADVLLDPEPYPLGRPTPNSEGIIGSDVLVGLTNWPAIVELARDTGVVIYQGPEVDLDEDEEI